MVMYSGLMRILKTTLFFADDPVLSLVPRERQDLLRAKGKSPYEFNICLRGENETPFFDD
jgi:protocatechuate 3,4-dioxygenase beta subunit